MFLIPNVKTVYMYPRPVNMRWGENKLTSLCRDEMGIDPATGAVFLFFNRPRDSLKLFFYDETGSQDMQKKLDIGGFTLPEPDVRDKFVKIPGHTIHRIFRSPGSTNTTGTIRDLFDD